MNTASMNAPTLLFLQPDTAPVQTVKMAAELQAIRDEIGQLATEIRHFQAFGIDGDFDEWAFSLTFLEARLTQIVQSFPVREKH